jgi:integrase/recombinase XerD
VRRGAAPDRRRAAAATSSAPATRSPRRSARTRRSVGELAGIVRATERIWRRAHLTYDQVRLVAKLVRARLELARPAHRGAAVDRLSREDVDRLFAAGYRAPAPRGLLIKTLYYTGARVAELVGIKVDDVYLDEAMIRIRDGKGGKARTVPIPAELAHELRTHLAGRRAGWLFETRSARPFSPRRVEQIVHEVAAVARIAKRVYPHLLRHTIAQHLLEGGMPLDQVQRFLGHASSETTQIYAEASLAMIRNAYRHALGAAGGWGRAEFELAAPSAPPRAGGRAPPPAPALRDSDRRTAPGRRAAPATSRSARRSRVRRS